MRKPDRRRAPLIAVALAGLALAASLVVPALGSALRVAHPETAFHRATRALRLAAHASRTASVAFRRSQLALSIAKSASRSVSSKRGPTGPRGQTGSRGPKGATGSAGLSAASYASFANAALPLLGAAGSPATYAPVIDLDSGAHAGPLKIASGAVVLANASVLLRSSEPTLTGEAVCKLQISDPTAGFVNISQVAATTIAPGGASELPITGALPRSAGSYDVRVVCEQLGSTLLKFDRSTLTVSAAA